MKYIIVVILCMLNSTLVYAKFTLDKFGSYIESGTDNNEIVITNTGSSEILVFSKEDTKATKKIIGKSLFYIYPSVIKLEPKESRVVNVILKDKNIKKEELGRLVFKEMVSTKNVSTKSVVNTSYNIAVIGRPFDLIQNAKPWEKLLVRIDNNKLVINNPSNYIVKMMSGISLLNKDEVLEIIKTDRNYILPNQIVSIPIKGKRATRIKIQPVSVSSNILSPVFIDL
ncbi:fimbria/pilus periplasmic chaperone [Photobacterium carnosum]|uniref:fimbria/pilus periplasmic chaperone n=1 Tax=Photobacterium carnosum TaxID=2023717 RepID=UPI001E62C76A|nr:fimbria/pilus periplasmic chaperone [Photobacterium carnosum]MCD9496840.1 fimbria/pilus periplasmic chaperone [Photobacterium carnosum]MCD9517087.1 fimbria/pilus periplasmic chaperone [Photobacterium carnosum]MCD9524817.1 fimbria/pilus periplasmic chaperone [Photobacterium carnosum]MCD9526245.1 fimbria/pilus periplasmic chaperone [Photobacterium carnosum]